MTEPRTRPTPAEHAAMTPEQVADRWSELSAPPPVDAARLADPAYLSTLSQAQVADNWPAIQKAAKETPR